MRLRKSSHEGHLNKKMRLLALALAVILLGGPVAAEESKPAIVLDVDGPIGPATAHYVHSGLEKAQDQDASLVVLRMNTPGGLDTSMREIIQDILASPIPVVTYVAPSGARAASAGTYILYASHVAAMAPGTTVGAATPVQIGGAPMPFGGSDENEQEPKSEGDDGEQRTDTIERHPTMADKVLSDAVAYIRSLAQMRGRNAEWAEKAVREAVPSENPIRGRSYFLSQERGDPEARSSGESGSWPIKEQGSRIPCSVAKIP